jgi:hypothetical protein
MADSNAPRTASVLEPGAEVCERRTLMRVRFAFFAVTAAILLSVGTAAADTGYVDAYDCYVGVYHTGYRVLSTIHWDSGVGWGDIDLLGEGCYDGTGNNTMTLNMTVEVRNTVTWELLSTGTSISYRWEGSTTACQVTLVVHLWGERYEGEHFDMTINGAPISCDP